MQKSRKYRQIRRAEQAEATRSRIVEAAAELHGSQGPARTTVAAIAEKAGVERLTVYRHFPDQEVLFEACTSLWLERNPLPDPVAWRGLQAVNQRRKLIVEILYDYFLRTADMWRLSWRDRALLPTLDARMRLVDDYLAAVAADIAGSEANRDARVTARHIVAFHTWCDLERQGLSQGEKCRLVLHWLEQALRS